MDLRVWHRWCVDFTRALLLLVAFSGCRSDSNKTQEGTSNQSRPAVPVGGAPAARKEIEYHRVEFPGFSLEVPTNLSFDKDPTASYRWGNVGSKAAPPVSVIVRWDVGPLASVEELRQLFQQTQGALPAAKEIQIDRVFATKINGHDATRLDARAAILKISSTTIACGKRVVIVYLTTERGRDEVPERILSSFDCHPIALQEAALDTTVAPFGIEDPAMLAGWRSTSTGGTFSISNGELTLTAVQGPPINSSVWRSMNSTPAQGTGKLVPLLFKEEDMAWTTERIETRKLGGDERMFHLGQLRSGGQATAGVLALWSCSERADSVMALALSPTGRKLTPAVELLAKLRCVKTGEPPLTFASSPLPPAPSTPSTPSR